MYFPFHRYFRIVALVDVSKNSANKRKKENEKLAYYFPLFMNKIRTLFSFAFSVKNFIMFVIRRL